MVLGGIILSFNLNLIQLQAANAPPVWSAPKCFNLNLIQLQEKTAAPPTPPRTGFNLNLIQLQAVEVHHVPF